MIILIECIMICILFTVMVMIMAKEPIKTLYNYPPKIQERVKSIEEYRDKIPTEKSKFATKILFVAIIVILISIVFRYINGYTTFGEGFGYSLLIWTIVNIYDVVIMDICWFCHSPKFVFNGTEDMVKEYRNYMFHIKQGFIGQILGTVICVIIGLVIQFIL